MFSSQKNIFVIRRLLISFFSLLFVSCQSVKEPKTISTYIDYNDEKVVESEIERITDMLKDEPVRGLWRAKLLGREDVIQSAMDRVQELLEESIQNNEYNAARKYYTS